LIHFGFVELIVGSAISQRTSRWTTSCVGGRPSTK